MIIYTDKYTESDKRIKNNNLLYTIHRNANTSFEQIKMFVRKNRNRTNTKYIQNKTVNPLFIYIP